MQAEVPKQYLMVAGKSLLQHSLERLGALPEIDRIVVALAAEDSDWPMLLQHLPGCSTPVIDYIIAILGTNNVSLAAGKACLEILQFILQSGVFHNYLRVKWAILIVKNNSLLPECYYRQ